MGVRYLFLFGIRDVQEAGHGGSVVHPTFHIRPDTPTPTSAGYQELGLFNNHPTSGLLKSSVIQ